MSFTLFPDLLLLLVVIICFGFAIFVFIRAQKITKSVAYIYLSISLIIQFLGYGFLVATSFFSPGTGKESFVLKLAISTNVTIGLSFLIFVYSIILIREDKLSIFSHIATLLVGASSMLISLVNKEQLVFNPDTTFWEINYITNDYFIL